MICKALVADRSGTAALRFVVAASRLLGAAAACVILLSFAAGHRKSYWSAASGDFPSKIAFKKCFKIVLCLLWRRDPGFGGAISEAVARSSIGFCSSIFANRIVMAASRLVGAAAACLLQLDIVNCIGVAASRLR